MGANKIVRLTRNRSGGGGGLIGAFDRINYFSTLCDSKLKTKISRPLKRRRLVESALRTSEHLLSVDFKIYVQCKCSDTGFESVIFGVIYVTDHVTTSQQA